MSNSHVIIKGISLYDIDLDSDISDDDSLPIAPASTATELRFITEKEEKYSPPQDISLQAINTENLNEILADIKTEEAIELTSGGFEGDDQEMADFRRELEDGSGVVKQTWLSDEAMEDFCGNSSEFESGVGIKSEEEKADEIVSLTTLNFARKSTSAAPKVGVVRRFGKIRAKLPTSAPKASNLPSGAPSATKAPNLPSNVQLKVIRVVKTSRSQPLAQKFPNSQPSIVPGSSNPSSSHQIILKSKPSTSKSPNYNKDLLSWQQKAKTLGISIKTSPKGSQSASVSPEMPRSAGNPLKILRRPSNIYKAPPKVLVVPRKSVKIVKKPSEVPQNSSSLLESEKSPKLPKILLKLPKSSSNPDENFAIKQEFTDSSTPIRVSALNGEPPAKMFKLSPGADTTKFKVIKTPSNVNINNLAECRFLKIPQSEDAVLSATVKQEPEASFFTDDEDTESDSMERLQEESQPKPTGVKSLNKMFENTLRNQGPPVKKTVNWIKFSKANAMSRMAAADGRSLPTTSQAVRVPRTITISKVSSVRAPMPFKCVTCCIAFASSERYATHMRAVHGREAETTNRYRCIKCKGSFATKDELIIHVNRHEKDFKCHVCSKEFTQNHRLQEHLALHADDRAFHCKLCDRKFSRSDVLNQHIKIYHSRSSKAFKCGVCNYETMVKQNFEKHENMHLRYAEKLRTNKFFYCDECPQSFRDVSVLQAHKEFMH